MTRTLTVSFARRKIVADTPQEALETIPEVWQQDATDKDLWHGPNGLIVNSDALEARKHYFEMWRIVGHYVAS